MFFVSASYASQKIFLILGNRQPASHMPDAISMSHQTESQNKCERERGGVFWMSQFHLFLPLIGTKCLLMLPQSYYARQIFKKINK